MKPKSLTIALVCAGVVAAGTASAFSWSPSEWFQHKPQIAQSNVAPVASPAAPAVASIGPIAAPNYRAIVER